MKVAQERYIYAYIHQIYFVHKRVAEEIEVKNSQQNYDEKFTAKQTFI